MEKEKRRNAVFGRHALMLCNTISQKPHGAYIRKNNLANRIASVGPC